MASGNCVMKKFSLPRNNNVNHILVQLNFFFFIRLNFIED